MRGSKRHSGGVVNVEEISVKLVNVHLSEDSQHPDDTSTGRLVVKKQVTYCPVPGPAVSSAGRCYILVKESD